MGTVRAIGRLMEAGTRVLIVVLISLMLVDVWLGIFFRYVIGSALAWTEELARYLMVWAGFLAASLALKEGAHIGIEAFLRPLPDRARRVGTSVATFLVVVFLSAVVLEGSRLLLTIAGQRTPVLGVSMVWPYLAIPVGSFLMLVQLLLTVSLESSDR